MRFSISRLLFVAAIVALIAFVYTSNLFPVETRSVNRYLASKSQFQTNLVSHFPSKQPNSSTNPVFSFFPGMLQGGAWLQLRVETSSEDAQNISQRLNAETTHTYKGGSFFTNNILEPDNYWQIPPYHTYRRDNKAFEFPDHFTLYVHYMRDGGAWNHGETAGTAVSLKTNEVIYWAENW